MAFPRALEVNEFVIAKEQNIDTQLNQYLSSHRVCPLFIQGDTFQILREFPSNIIDMAMTSPPYWGKREYRSGGIGLESHYEEYICNLLRVFGELRRVLKPAGSFWLNIGDTYQKKNLVGIPWRLAIRMTDEQGWILRNNVIWNKVKGSPDNTKDRLRNLYENVFHFVKQPRGYYYDADAIRSKPKQAKVVNGSIVSATGVRGVRYKRQIELSTELSSEEKAGAEKALEAMLLQVAKGEIADFRMIIRGQQRTTHSNSIKISGRAKELRDRGYYFLKYHPNGAKPSDVWEIIPEDTQKRKLHFAPYPRDLCRIPILATCPPGGVALDPFCGTGTTMLVASELLRKSIGIDLSGDYIQTSEDRCITLL